MIHSITWLTFAVLLLAIAGCVLAVDDLYEKYVDNACEPTATQDCDAIHASKDMFDDDNDGARLRIDVKPSALPRVAALAAHILDDYLRTHNTFLLPNFTDDVIAITQLSVENVTFSRNISVTFIDDVGIQINMENVNFDVPYRAALAFDTADYLANAARVHDARFAVTLAAVANASAHNRLQIHAAQTVVHISHIDVISEPVPPHSRFVRVVQYLLNDTFEPVLARFIGDEAASVAARAVATASRTHIDEIVALDDAGAVLNITMPRGASVNASDGLSVWLDGDVYDAARVPAVRACSLPRPPSLPAAPSAASLEARGIFVTASQSIVDCLLLTEQASGHIRNIVNSFLKAMNFDEKLNITMILPLSAGDFRVSAKSGFEIDLTVSARIARVWNQPELYLTADANTSVTGKIYFPPLAHLSSNAGSVNISELRVDFNVPVSGLSASFPEKYKQQIKESNFTRLSAKLNDALSSALEADINPRLRDILPLPSPFKHYLKGFEVNWFDGAAQIGLDVRD